MPPAIVWRWTPALLGAIYAIPGAVVILDDRSRGLGLVLGALPAAIVGLPATRRGRLAIPVLGTAVGVPMALGGLLAGVPVLAVLALFAAGVGAALLAARVPFGQIAMTLSLPLLGIGLSYSDLGTAFGVAALMVLGSVFACGVTMLWPEREPPPRPPRPAIGPTLEYGIRLGLAGATAAAIGFILDLEHVGWACGAALLVMRPAAEMQRLRSAGRIVSVALGALAAVLFVEAGPPSGLYSVAVIVVLAAAAATHGSRWYVTPAFTTFLVFLLLLYADPSTAQSRFNERLLETALGIGIAYFYGLVVKRRLGNTGRTVRETPASP